MHDVTPSRTAPRPTRPLRGILLAAMLLLAAAPWMPAELARAQVELPSPPDAVPAPDVLGEAAAVLGLVEGEARSACSTLGIPYPDDPTGAYPDVLLEWFGQGYQGVVDEARRNFESVAPEELIAFLRHHQHQGETWANWVLWLINNCQGGFAFCSTQVLSATEVKRHIWCVKCCSAGEIPFASCEGAHFTATCGCTTEA